METRISGLSDAPRVGGVQAKLDTDTRSSGVLPVGIAPQAKAQYVDETDLAVAITKPVENAEVDLQAAVVEMNDFVQAVNRDIDFNLDDESGEVVVNIMDRETGNIIRQIPSEEALRLAESLSEARSLLFKTEA
jgi:flagellar protein FlaG